MKDLDRTVDWTKYAQKYDMLMSYNPFYQALHQEVIGFTDTWKIEAGDVILDMGAGTGNYSIDLAKKFPQAQIIHIDRDEGMNEVAKDKKVKHNLNNLKIIQSDAESISLEAGTLKACLCIHFLYTQSNPEVILSNIHEWMSPGGYGIFVDPGKAVNVLDWQMAIAIKMIRQHGLIKTFKVMKEGAEVSKQNREISKLQANGTYWTHSSEDFRSIIKNAGFNIMEYGRTFRKLSDWALVTKI